MNKIAFLDGYMTKSAEDKQQAKLTNRYKNAVNSSGGYLTANGKATKLSEGMRQDAIGRAEKAKSKLANYNDNKQYQANQKRWAMEAAAKKQNKQIAKL